MIRLYWLGVATEPGLWAIDTGPGTTRLRVHAIVATGTAMVDPRAGTIKPRAYLGLIDVASVTVRAHETEITPTIERVRDLIDIFGVDQSPE